MPPSYHRAAVLRAAMEDPPGLNAKKSSFCSSSLELVMPRLALFESLTTREILLAIPAGKLVRMSVNNLMGLVRAAKRDKCFDYLLTALGYDIGPEYTKVLAQIIPRTNKVHGRAPVTRLLFLARLSIAIQFHTNTLTIRKEKGPKSVFFDMPLIVPVRKAIDQLHVAVHKKKKEEE